MKTELVIRDYTGDIQKQEYEDAKITMYPNAFQVEVRETIQPHKLAVDQTPTVMVKNRLFFPTSWLITIRQEPVAGEAGSKPTE